MRSLVALLTLVISPAAQAQCQWGCAPYYSWGNVPYHRSPAPSRPSGSIAGAMLAAHNAVRARVGVPPLVWSPQLAAVAQNWANTLTATHRLAHSTADRYGENLYAISGGMVSPGAWAGEAHGYDIRSNGCAGVCGHYTQLVWRTTRAVGCAVASEANREVWVCEYDPPGNIVGYRPY